MEANLIFELVRSEKDLAVQVGFNADARVKYLRLATDPSTPRPENFRIFSGSIRRLCTLAPRGRVTRAMADDEIATLERDWKSSGADEKFKLAEEALGEGAVEIDPFDMVQLAEVIPVCRNSVGLSAAGSGSYSVSCGKRKTQNKADRLKTCLHKVGLDRDRVSVANE